MSNMQSEYRRGTVKFLGQSQNWLGIGYTEDRSGTSRHPPSGERLAPGNPVFNSCRMAVTDAERVADLGMN